MTMGHISKMLSSKTSLLNALPEVSPGGEQWSMWNDGGVELEVGEFLYSLVRMVKPAYLLETGTHLGISAAYIATALLENEMGYMTTYEVIKELQLRAINLWNDLGVKHVIESKLLSSLQEGDINQPIDVLFLDSEPQLRFAEFVKYWPRVVPGGVIIIHDLHPSMGHHGTVMHGQYDWPYGDFRQALGPYIKSFEVQTINFKTPRGLTLFQKTGPEFEVTKYLRGERE